MLVKTNVKVSGVSIQAPISDAFNEILSQDALAFIAELHRKFNSKRLAILWQRIKRQEELDKGILPGFLAETASIRESDWIVAPLPADLLDRRVEITGPVDRKMVINALNSGAKVFMADLEDSNSPTWENCINGQINLRDAVSRDIQFTNIKGKRYKLNEQIAVLMVRPRGWHLPEKHLTIDGEEASGSLFDFGLYFYHNAKKLIANGSGPYFYLPKIESHMEARLWNEVFVFAQKELNIPLGTIKATVLLETIMASFEMDEILYELREHSAGLNCGRWDYIFSYIKKLRNVEGYMLPDRGQVTMTTPFMSAYSQLVIKTCHKRNVHAMGGMAAFIPIKNDEQANQEAMDKVLADKELEALNGHDGTWVAHPGLVNLATEVFDKYMPNANQIDNKRLDVNVGESDLLEVPQGDITEAGLRLNINVGILYIESWLQGVGAAAIYNLMEDAATAEISRTQVWQWIKNAAVRNDGKIIDYQMVKSIIPVELKKIKNYVGTSRYEAGRFEEAASIFDDLIKNKEFIEFLTLAAYKKI
ncbi:MAG: malate synthase [Limisphaerales bacterium]|jgi:malate synthase